MAKSVKRQDPTEAALSAIEEALRLQPIEQQKEAAGFTLTAEPRLPAINQQELFREMTAPPAS